ncbi:O-antigen ligase [Gilvimarinus sp. DA14]|uniref:O-antigen ligase family protein n=1 Tax=Gilvimarinus sp. DA14 TaxID=2956798 RepID=UPI0020B8AD12|nr:O-antigen ligase family protein [Gilvimarinus sp. DA14]UTF61677.1 O-antigen ligase family protein [Gilvimarinus sp. DA14]
MIKRPALGLNRKDAIMIGALLACFVLNCTVNLIHGASSRYYEEPSRYLLAVGALLAILGCRPLVKFWWVGLIIGASSAGVYALIQVLMEHRERAFGLMNPIQFGNLSILMSGLCLAGLGWAKRQSCSGYWVLALAAAATLGILASVLSGARGGWLAFPAIVLILFFNLRSHLPRRVLYTSCATALAFLAALYLIPQTGVQERVNRGAVETAQYLSGKSVGRSVGLRLEMWRSASTLIDEKPLAGWGEEGYIEPMMQRIDDSKVREGVSRFSHVHNDVLDVSVKRGVLGLLALLIIYTVPLALFCSEALRMKRSQVEAKAFAMSGIILVVSVVLFGLTQAFLRHNSGVTLYAFMLVAAWGYMRCAQQREVGEAYA